ncbi:MAG: hypothetical protein FJX59_13465 [Alphaproteobacteria bacterium]|nr:hypothetical protein [Alphaproteobacteria bacterium]
MIMKRKRVAKGHEQRRELDVFLADGKSFDQNKLRSDLEVEIERTPILKRFDTKKLAYLATVALQYWAPNAPPLPTTQSRGRPSVPARLRMLTNGLHVAWLSATDQTPPKWVRPSSIGYLGKGPFIEFVKIVFEKARIPARAITAVRAFERNAREIDRRSNRKQVAHPRIMTCSGRITLAETEQQRRQLIRRGFVPFHS